MMGASHAMSGLTVGVLAAGALTHAPLPVRLLVIPVIGGASLLPDLDHPQGTAARSLGPITKILARVLNELSLQIYHATRGPGDPKHRRDGHRLITHTLPGCAAVGIPGLVLHLVGGDLMGSLGVDPWWRLRIPGIITALTIGITLGLLARTSRSIGAGFTLVGTGLAYWVAIEYSPWWWVWPVALVLGCVTHVAGDGCTVSGVPVLFPLTVHTNRGAQRWFMMRIPGAFETGKEFEREFIMPLLVVSLIASVGWVTGILPTLIRSAWEMAHG